MPRSFWDRTDATRARNEERERAYNDRQMKAWGWRDTRERDWRGALVPPRKVTRHAPRWDEPLPPPVEVVPTPFPEACEVCGKPDANVAYFVTGMIRVAYLHHACDAPEAIAALAAKHAREPGR